MADVSEPSSPIVVGSITQDSTHLHNPWAVAVPPSDNYVYGFGIAPNSIVVVAVTVAGSPVVVGSITQDSAHTDGSRGVAVSPCGRYVYVTGMMTRTA